jgi:hypothetical protein
MSKAVATGFLFDRFADFQVAVPSADQLLDFGWIGWKSGLLKDICPVLENDWAAVPRHGIITAIFDGVFPLVIIHDLNVGLYLIRDIGQPTQLHETGQSAIFHLSDIWSTLAC